MEYPNILFLFSDQHRGDWLPYEKEIFDKFGMKELPIRMPNIKRLMKEGVTFSRAVTPSPLCAPARACLASGLRYEKCGVPNNDYDYPLKQKTFYSILKENGYKVAGVGKFDLHKATRWWGLKGWIEDMKKLGFTDAIDNAGKWDAIMSYCDNNSPQDPYMKYLKEKNLVDLHVNDMKKRKDKLYTKPTKLTGEDYCDNWLTNNGINMLRDFPEDKPWFLQVNFSGPHSPWDITKRMKKKWENEKFPLPIKWDKAFVKKINAVRQNYAAMLENIDRNIGLLINEVEKRDELDNTLIIYSADHGELLGDFNKFGKVRPERGSVRIPLIISKPDLQQGVISEALVELQDLSNTILDFAGLFMPEAEDSKSLKPILTGKIKEHRHYQISAFNTWEKISKEDMVENKKVFKGWKMINSKRYKLILEENEDLYLYDLYNDPLELNDVSSSNLKVVKSLINFLEEQ